MFFYYFYKFVKSGVGTVYHIRQTNRSEIRNGERTPTHGSERIQPADT